jgi:hypothetical protein
MSGRSILGPGTLRVGRFIGRLGVVSLPAVQAGLDLDQRVVRRHVAKLEAAGWLGRAPWVWGEGSVVWLTGSGVQGTGLGGLRPIKAPPAPTTIGHGVLVGWSGARAEHRGRPWKSARELELDRERWAAPMRCERGYTEQLPDLAVWPERSKTPGAVVAESGGRLEDRQKMILEGWRDAVWSGRYMGVRYDCASPSVARWINRLAKKVGLADVDFTAAMQTTAEQIATLPPAASATPSDEATTIAETKPSDEAGLMADEEAHASAKAPAPEQPVQVTPSERYRDRARRWRPRADARPLAAVAARQPVGVGSLLLANAAATSLRPSPAVVGPGVSRSIHRRASIDQRALRTWSVAVSRMMRCPHNFRTAGAKRTHLGRPTHRVFSRASRRPGQSVRTRCAGLDAEHRNVGTSRERSPRSSARTPRCPIRPCTDLQQPVRHHVVSA